MSSVEGSDGEDPEEDEDEGEATQAGDANDEDDAKVHRKLHLFRCPSVRQSIQRLWGMLPRPEGELLMDGYVELNLRLQRCLSEDFDLERAIESAMGDWSEDVPEGSQTMTQDEFAMFLFELCSLWCGPSINLRAYLLFLNTLFINITEARGAHSVGLKELQAVERLPSSFFDLLSMQGWGSGQTDSEASGLKGEHAFNAWFAANVSPEAEQASLLQVQRQVFQISHDVRSIFLFQDQDGRPRDARDALEQVRVATENLERVSQAPRSTLPALKGNLRGAPAELTDKAAHTALAKQTARPEVGAVAVTSMVPAPHRRRDSAPLGSLKPPRAEIPVGRAFETRRTAGRGQGLISAGQSALALTAPSSSATPQPLRDGVQGRAGSAGARRTPSRGAASAGSLQPINEPMESHQPIEDPFQAQASAVSSRAPMEIMAPAQSARTYPAGAPMCFKPDYGPLYELPKEPKGLYSQQVAPLMSKPPKEVVYEAEKWQYKNRMLREPFDKVLRKLPEHVRPDVGPKGGIGVGPMGNPSEPVFFEMAHRLQSILQKQGKRAERRRKRRLRAKLQRCGRSRPTRQGQTSDLREYLNRHAELQRDPSVLRAQGPGEFLGKVHERYLLHKDSLESPRFMVPSVGHVVDGVHGIGELPQRAAAVVRPVYVPPPNSRMEVL